LILTLSVCIGDLWRKPLKKKHLCNSLSWIDSDRERGAVENWKRYVSFPLGFKRSDIHQDSASRISGFPHAQTDDIPGNAEILQRAAEDETVGWNKALWVGEAGVRFLPCFFWIHMGLERWWLEKKKLIGKPEVIPIAGKSIGDFAFLHKRCFERFNQPS
jgi:hypothetical protein